MKKLILFLLILGFAGSNIASGQTVEYGNNEVSNYTSSQQSSSFTYLMWDRNDEGDGYFANPSTPKFFYWDNDDSKFHYLLDTGNMSQLKAMFQTLSVGGIAKAEEIIVEENTGADFVFEEDYDLPNLQEVEAHIKKAKHLQGIPTATEMKENGVKVGDLQMKLLQKIEELTLYVIELKKENEKLAKKIKKLEKH